jgi:hypothetical protein
MMQTTEKQPSVWMTIWCEGSVHYAHTRTNANPHDEKLKYLKLMSFWSKIFNPWLEVRNELDNTFYLIKKSKILIMEFKWVKEDND